MVIANSTGEIYEDEVSHSLGLTREAMNRTPANDNKQSIQINPTPYEDAMIQQSWERLGKELGPKPPVLTVVPKSK